jgi:hypothetical protein
MAVVENICYPGCEENFEEPVNEKWVHCTASAVVV